MAFSSILAVIIWLLFTDYSLQSTPDNNEDIIDVQLYEGDIVLTREQQQLMESSRVGGIHSPQNAVARDEQFHWPEGIVPYEIDSTITEATAVQAIFGAIEEYENKTCIRFKPRDPATDSDFVQFYRGYGCSSFIGRRDGGQQISIGRGCDRTGIVIHEIFHALGRWHEQARSDRNEYVTINFDNIREGFETNFATTSIVFTTTQGVPYDYDSIMHYGATAFSSNGQPTIVPRKTDIDPQRLGQRDGLSENDIAHVRALYCGGDGAWSGWGSWSSCSRTCNGGTRGRRRTCIGDTSCPGTNMEEMPCNIIECPSVPEWSGWSTWSGCTVLCGGGRRSRVRSCMNGSICEGEGQEYQDCNVQECPNSLSTWSSWSDCNRTCQGGYRYRSRVCRNSAVGDCLGGETKQLQECNSHISCDQWIECSRSCGGGVQTHRTSKETRKCNEQPCHNEICLRGIKHVGCYKLSLLSGVLEYFAASDPSTNNPTNKTEPIRKCADRARSLDHPYFAVSLIFCFTGSNQLDGYLDDQGAESSICRNGTGNYFGSILIGDLYHIEDSRVFDVSSTQVRNCGQNYCINNETLCDEVFSSANNTCASFVLLLLAIITVGFLL